AILSLVQVIMAAEAGEKANADSIAAAIRVFILEPHWKRKPADAGQQERICHAKRFGKKTISILRRNDCGDSSCILTRRRQSQGFERPPILPVAVSVSHEALPRSWA